MDMAIGRASVVILDPLQECLSERSQYNEVKAQRQKQNPDGVLKVLKPAISEAILYFGLLIYDSSVLSFVS